MSYRPHLYKIAKKHDNLRNCSAKDWSAICGQKGNYGIISFYDLPFYWDTEKGGGNLEPYHRNFDLYKKWEEEFHIMRNIDLRHYIKKVIEMHCVGLSAARADPNKATFFLSHQYYAWHAPRDKGKEMQPMDVNIEEGLPFNDSTIEFDIMNLIVIYREFDWENYHLIYGAL